MRLKVADRKKMNARFYELGKKYHEAIPLHDISVTLQDHGLELLDDDYTPWSGLLCGSNSQCTFNVGQHTDNGYDAVKNSVLCLSWYRMPSGRYEIVVYLS